MATFKLVNISEASVVFGAVTLAPYGKKGCAKVCTGTPAEFNKSWALFKAIGLPIGKPTGGEYTALQSAPYTHATFNGVVNTAGMAAQLTAVLIENDADTVRTTRVVNTETISSIMLGSTTLAPYGQKGCAKWVTGNAVDLNVQWAAYKLAGNRDLAVAPTVEFDALQSAPYTHATYNGGIVMTAEMLKT